VPLLFTGDLFDRYLLAFLPFFILYLIRDVAGWGRRAWTYSVVALIVFAGFSLCLKADQIDHDSARWAAGHWLLTHAGPPQVGYDWNNWVEPGSPAYYVADLPLPGFRVEQHFSYLSRLSGFTQREVLAQVQADQPPLPTITPPPPNTAISVPPAETCSLAPGAMVPMPTRPRLVMRSLSRLLVRIARPVLSTVPRKSVLRLVPALPWVNQGGGGRQGWCNIPGVAVTVSAERPSAHIGDFASAVRSIY
jgi:hypothetical protein